MEKARKRRTTTTYLSPLISAILKPLFLGDTLGRWDYIRVKFDMYLNQRPGSYGSVVMVVTWGA